MRRPRLFWQLFLGTFLIALVALAVLALDASSSLRQFYLARTAEDLESRASLVEDRVVPLLAAKEYAQIDALCKQLGKRSSTRLTVILPDGTVVGDSLESPQKMDNHALRPEVAAALEKGEGVSLRYSRTVQQTQRYVAVPVRDHGQVLGVVRAAVSLATIDGALWEMRSHILVASLLVALLLAVASQVIARRVVQPLDSD
jgi:two-component system phosphate regulon sensor histidine kinase PhoR